MGLSNDGGGRVTWLSVSKGKFVLGKKEEAREFSKLSGLVTSISFRDREYENKKWREVLLRVEDGEEIYQFGVGIGTGYGTQLLGKLATADLQSVVMLEPSYETATKKAGFFVTQGSTALKQKWTRANPGDMPELVEMTVKGQKVWDDTNRNAWLEKYYLDNVCSKVAKVDRPDEGEGVPDDEESDDYNAPF